MSEEKKENRPGFVEIIQALEKLGYDVESISHGYLNPDDNVSNYAIKIILEPKKRT